MSFKRIKPILTGEQARTFDEPSLYRACVTGNEQEYNECETLIQMYYQVINKRFKKFVERA